MACMLNTCLFSYVFTKFNFDRWRYLIQFYMASDIFLKTIKNCSFYGNSCYEGLFASEVRHYGFFVLKLEFRKIHCIHWKLHEKDMWDWQAKNLTSCPLDFTKTHQLGRKIDRGKKSKKKKNEQTYNIV